MARATVGIEPPAAASPRRGPLTAVLVSIRPQEWVKNGFVFAPLAFAGLVDDAGAVLRSAAGFLAFCAVAGAGYLVNDARDIELDRQHPHKRDRPVARGELAPRTAIGIAIALACGGLAMAAVAGLDVVGVLLAYAALALAYSMALKHLVIIDVMTIAAGFVLRVLAGVAAVDAPSTEWLVMCTGMLALFLAVTKRRQEAISDLHDGLRSRPVLEHYSLPFLDQMVGIAAAGTVISYALASVSSENIDDRMLATSIPVLYGVLRYLFLIYHRRDTRSTASLIASDPGIIAAGITWLGLAGVLAYV